NERSNDERRDAAGTPCRAFVSSLQSARARMMNGRARKQKRSSWTLPAAASTVVQVSVVKLEQLARIIASDFATISFTDRADIEPGGGVIDVLERPVSRKHDAVRAEHQDRIDQRLGMKISGRGDVEIAAEIIAHPLLGRIVVPVLDPAIGIV